MDCCHDCCDSLDQALDCCKRLDPDACKHLADCFRHLGDYAKALKTPAAFAAPAFVEQTRLASLKGEFAGLQSNPPAAAPAPATPPAKGAAPVGAPDWSKVFALALAIIQALQTLFPHP